MTSVRFIRRQKIKGETRVHRYRHQLVTSCPPALTAHSCEEEEGNKSAALVVVEVAAVEAMEAVVVVEHATTARIVLFDREA